MNPDLPPFEQKASLRQWIGVLGAVLGAFMAVLDVSITNASLQNIQGALSASLDESSWIATSYLIAEIITIPLTGWLSNVFSVRRYLFWNAILFLFFSVCCAMSWNLSSMIVFRALQGFTGGVLIPMAASIIVSTLPPGQRAMGLALFSISATFAPAIGPTVGGWLTVNYSWEYIFYLNLVPGALLCAAVSYAIDPVPMRLELLKKGDWWGILTMALGLGSLTVVLEEGNRNDWFGSKMITWLAITAVISLIAFVWLELKQKNPFINLRLLKRRNFGLTGLLSLSLGLGIYGSVYILPLYLASVQHYDALQIGYVLMWVGLPQLLILPFVPMLLKRFDARLLLAVGVFFFALSCFVNGHLDYNVAGEQLTWSQIIRALGNPFIFTPLSTVAFEGIEPHEVGSASGLYNMLRNLGGSVGIGILSTMLTRRYQFHFSRITESISTVSIEAQQRIAQLSAGFVHKGYSVSTAHDQAVQAIAGTINREAYIMAYSDCFLFMCYALLVAGVTIFLLKKVAPGSAPVAEH